MARHKVMAIGLDGFDATLAERYMAEGQMPALAELKKRAARFLLDEGAARRAGLPWEHVASGLSPEAAGRWGPVDFDPASYTAWQAGAQFAPWWAETDLRVVVFDPPFVDLCAARNTQGIVGWGSHSPGTRRIAGPTKLLAEFVRRFGDYPADEWTYGTPWPSTRRCQQMGEGLSHALDVRSRAAQWLATERFPDWEFFFAVAGELHSGMEGLWHGVDASHPLNTHPSAAPAAAALFDIHRALDRMVGLLVKAAGDAVVIAFNMEGRGRTTATRSRWFCSPNCSTDTPSVTRCSRSLRHGPHPRTTCLFWASRKPGMRRARRGFPNRPANLSPRRWRRICARSLIASRNR